MKNSEPNCRSPNEPEGGKHCVPCAIYGLLAALGAYVVYGVVERLWPSTGDRQTLTQTLPCLISAIVFTALAGWIIIRTSPGFMPSAPTDEARLQLSQTTPIERAKIYARWFIAMRWMAALLAGILVFISVQLVGWLPQEVWRPLVTIVAALCGFNLLYLLLLRWQRAIPVSLVLQSYLDLVILTALLHFAGGIENPFSMMMIFHVIIGGILLSRRQCYGLAAAASGLFVLLAWAEWSDTIEHYTLELFPHEPEQNGELFHPAHHSLYVLARCFLHTTVIFLTAYFVTTLSERLRQNERKLQAMADSAVGRQQLLEQAITEQKRSQAQMIRAGQLAAVGELAGRVAHEVNNPIAIISAKSRLLLVDHHGEMSPKVTQELGKITDYADRVARIAQGLLSYCRPSPATRSRLDVRQPIRKSLAMVEQHARSSGVKILDELADGLPPVTANAGELEQIFLNLFLNALDAMPHGGELKVSTNGKAVSGDGGMLIAVKVEDTGTGIPETIRDKIFEPFFTTKQDGRGTGLGLSICLGLVRSHDGQIKVEGEPGKGSRFIVTLPVAASLSTEKS